MYLPKTGKPRKTNRSRCVRYTAKLRAKNRQRRRRLMR